MSYLMVGYTLEYQGPKHGPWARENVRYPMLLLILSLSVWLCHLSWWWTGWHWKETTGAYKSLWKHISVRLEPHDVAPVQGAKGPIIMFSKLAEAQRSPSPVWYPGPVCSKKSCLSSVSSSPSALVSSSAYSLVYQDPLNTMVATLSTGLPVPWVLKPRPYGGRRGSPSAESKPFPGNAHALLLNSFLPRHP